MTEINGNPLGKVIERLREALAAFAKEPADSFIRDSVIKRFEFTFELSHKMLRRFLMNNAPAIEETKEMTFPTLIRTGSEYGLLLSGWDRWHAFREARNQTSHAYHEEKAQFVAAQASDFLAEAEFLYKQLIEKSA
jgi:nucleotidyltransferase substrate binding protein (TIGR01987 family)